jgi:septal ring factor EnvC (AmiA/AmiB activator)
LRRDVIQLVADIKQALEEKEYWDSDNDDAGKQLVKQAKALLKQLDKQQNLSQDERASLELQIATENAQKNQLKASLKTMQDAKTAKVKQLTGFASARKTEEDSLVTGIDNIYQEFNIFRA